jgi:DNA (cytosine-5)-methyltransferase 1
MLQPTVISIFSGVGGFDLGFLQAGYKILCATDIDQTSLEYNFKNLRSPVLCSDIRAIAGEQLSLGRDIDVVIGGSPCQGFSIAGKRDPNDLRNRLIFEYARIVLEIKPRFFVFENVPSILLKTNVGLFTDFCRVLDIEYSLKFKILDLVNFGVPQNRKRLIVLGWRDGEKEPDYPQESQFPVKTVYDAIGCLENVGQVTNHQPKRLQQFKFLSQGSRLKDEHRLIRLSWGRPSPTVITKPKLVHPAFDRYITVKEASLLQGFPEGFIFSDVLSLGYQQVGNSVSPPLAKVIAETLKKVI